MRLGQKRSTLYAVECYDSNGALKWSDRFHNLVVTTGLNDSLDKHFKASSYTSAWYIGLTDGTPTFAVTDTSTAHAGWSEVSSYSDGARATLTLGTISAGSVDNSSNKGSFSINANATVGGAFLSTYSTVGSTGGILYGGGAFTGGDRDVADGDTLNVTVTLTASTT